MSKIKFITYEEALILYKRMMKRYGGEEKLSNPSGLQSSLNIIRATFQKRELYPEIWDKAGMLLFSLNKNHPFADGNKRMSALFAEIFLDVNGYVLDVSSREFKALVNKSAKSEVDKDGVIEWFKLHIRQKQLQQKILKEKH